MSDINPALEAEVVDTTGNGTESVEAIEPATTAEVASPEVKEEPKSISLDDALAKAFEKHTPKAETEPKGATPTTPVVTAEKRVDPVTGREEEPMKAPAGWTPLLKEKWSGIDPTVQRFISDREKDNARMISKTADERKVATEFREVVAPYEATLRQFNISGMQLAKDLMTQWHAMQTGNGQQKAQIFYNLLNHFKPDAQALQSLLSGQQVQAPPAAPNVEELVRKELSAREEAAQEAAINSDIDRFSADPANEFFGDVRESMGRIITAGLVTGNTNAELFKNAYDLACSQHPEIKQVLAERTASTGQVNVAAHSRPAPVRQVKPSLGTGQKSATPKKNMSLDEAVNAAFRMHSQ